MLSWSWRFLTPSEKCRNMLIKTPQSRRWHFPDRSQTKYYYIQSGMRTLDVQMQHQMRLFRAQRNFYIVGFTLFLCLVIRRLLGLILSNAQTQVWGYLIIVRQTVIRESWHLLRGARTPGTRRSTKKWKTSSRSWWSTQMKSDLQILTAARWEISANIWWWKQRSLNSNCYFVSTDRWYITGWRLRIESYNNLYSNFLDVIFLFK